MRLFGGLVFLTILICCFPALAFSVDATLAAPEITSSSKLVIEGRVVGREIRSSKETDSIEYRFYIEPTLNPTGPKEVLVARTSTSDLLGSLIDGKQAVLVLEPLPDGTYRLVDAKVSSTASLTSSTRAFPGAEAEHLVDGLMDLPGSAWASAGSPNWVEIDLGAPRLITEVSVAPFNGSPGNPYFYNQGWNVQYRDGLGELRDFSNVQMLVGAGTLVGPGIEVANADPGSTASLDSYKYYGFRFDPVSTRYIRYTVTEGDRDGDSNGAELEVRQGFLFGAPVTLDGSASDAEDGDISTSIAWSSDLDGQFGTGSSVTVSSLSVGTHAITALIQDSNGSQSTSTTNVTIVDSLPVTYSMTTSTAGTGTGVISSSPAGIDCGSDCSHTFNEDTEVTLTPTPDPDSTFVGWSGHADCSDGQVIMSGDRACTATFDLLPPVTFALAMTRTGTGSGTLTSSPSGINCGLDCSESYDEGTVVSLTATPDPGSTFAGWGGDADCSDGIIALTADRSCSARFDLLSYTLSTSTEGVGSGTISSTPIGIDCGGDCSQDYDYDTVVSLTATPDTGSTFAGWSGDADCADGSVTMTSARNCTATFGLQTISLTVERAGTGSGSVSSLPAGIDCGNDCSESYEYGTTVNLTATPNAGSSFVGWAGSGDCSDGSLSMTAARNCIAAFDLLPPVTFGLSIAIEGTGTGSVTSSPPGIDCGADCTETYIDGTVVALTATAASNSVFIGWGGDADCTDGQVAMNLPHTCTARFDMKSYGLTVTTGGSGNGTVTSTPAGIDCGTDCAQDYDYGTNVTLTATPNANSSFTGWSGDTDCSDGSLTLTAARACTATFELLPPDTYSLTVAKTGTGSGSITSSPAGIDCGPDCNETYEDGTIVTLTATPATGSAFAGWSGPADCTDGSVTVTSDLACTATFTLETRPLTVAKSGSGSGTITSTPAGIDCGTDCGQDYDYGTNVTLTATPDASSTFTGWNGDADCADGSVTMTAARACTATFELLPPDTYSLTVAKTGTGSGTVSSTPAGIDCGADCNETYDGGTTVTLTATPATGSAFAGWSGPADCTDGSVTVTSDLACTATFTLETRPLTVFKTGSGNGTATSTPAGIDCGTDCAQDYDYGTNVTLTATPDASSSFTGWSGDADCSDGSVTLNQGRSCTATFELLPPDTFSLTVAKTGTGSGTVTSSPAGIDCGPDCNETYDDGTTVTLTATPATGSAFAGWSGAADCADGSVTVTSDLACTATFTLETRPLTVARSGSGSGTITSTPAGIDCGTDCAQDYDYGTNVTLTATPDASSSFTGWSGDADCSDGSVTMTSAKSCTATFELLPPDTYSLTVAKTGTGSGSITSSPAGIDCGPDCNETYEDGTIVTLTATPATGSAFAGWSGPADCTDGSVTVTSDLACTATFTLETRPLTVATTGTGSGTVTSSPAGIDCGTDCSQDYDYGTNVTLTATPNANSSFTGWSGDTDCSDGSLTLTAARACTATFELLPPDTYSLTVAKTGTGSGSITSSPAGIDCGPDCNETYEDGTIVTLTATPATGSAFAGWSGPADCTDGSVTVTSDLACTATFTLETRPLTVAKSGSGSGTVTSSPAGIDCGTDCGQDYDYGTNVTLTATPDASSTFTGWNGDADCADGSVTMTAARACTATFELLPPDTYSLTVAKTGTGSGTVSSTPAGIDCGADCNETYDGGTTVTLTATPATGSAFAGWSGPADCSDGSVTMTSAKSCTATFELLPPDTFSLTVAKTGTGSGTVTSSPAGIDCGPDCNETYDDGTTVTLTATPATGSAFAGWSGAADCADGSVTVTSDLACTATFTLETRPLTVARSGSGSGTITSTPAGIDCGTDCAQDYDYGTNVTLTATPDASSSFTGWSGDADCSDGSVTMTSAKSCTATFELLPPDTFSLTVAKTGTGSGTVTSSPAGIDCGPDCNETYDDGTTVTLTATPATGSAFAGWSGAADCADGSVTVTSDLACTATFELLPPPSYTLTVFKTGSGNGTVTSTPTGVNCGGDCQESFAEGTTVTLTATPSTGSAFSGWSGDADCSDGTFAMLANASCTATFDELPSNSSPSIDLTSPVLNPAVRRPVISSGNEFPNADAERVVDGARDLPNTAWAARGAPNWVEIDLGGERMLDRVTVAPYIGHLGSPYFYDNEWTVQYRDDSGTLQDFANVVKLTGAGTLVGPGIRITNGDPGSASPNEAYKLYDLGFDPVELRYLRFTVTEGDVDNDSNAAEIGVHQVWHQGTPITFSAVATDPEEGDLTNNILWSSDLDGILGVGGSLEITTLSTGDHTIRAEITDALGATATHALSVRVIQGTISLFRLTIEVDGSGDVTSSPLGIECGIDCAEDYADGTEVTLTPTPDTGWSFVTWGGDADCSDGSVSMSAARTCRATFAPQTRTLTISKTGTGSGRVTSSPTGIDCGPDCEQVYDYATVVILDAQPDLGSAFVGWSGDADCGDGTITTHTDTSCTAIFELIPPASHTLTVTRSGNGTGSVTSSPAGIDCGSDCSEFFTDGTTVRLTATPTAGSVFVGWTGAADCQDGQITMTASRTCDAAFELVEPEIFVDGFDSGDLSAWEDASQ